MRQEIAYLLIVLTVAGIALSWLLASRKARRNRRSTLRMDIVRKDPEK